MALFKNACCLDKWHIFSQNISGEMFGKVFSWIICPLKKHRWSMIHPQVTHTYPQDAPDFFPQALHIFRGQAQVRPDLPKKNNGSSPITPWRNKMVAMTVVLCSVQMKQTIPTLSKHQRVVLEQLFIGKYHWKAIHIHVLLTDYVVCPALKKTACGSSFTSVWQDMPVLDSFWCSTCQNENLQPAFCRS